MRIPIGNFGNQEQRTIGQVPVDNSGNAAIGRAVDNVAQAGEQFGLAIRQQQLDMARTKATNALADHELQVKQRAQDIQQRVITGDLPYADAMDQYQTEVQNLAPPKIDNLDPITAENLSAGTKRVNEAGALHMQGFVAKQQQDDFRGQYVQFLDTQGKLAGMPGADIAQINASAAQVARSMAQKAGLSDRETAKSIQDWQDANWFNNAREKAIAARNDPAALKALENDLAAPDGYYQGKLDTDKRDTLLNHVMVLRTQLENKIQLQADRADARAQRTLFQIDQQIATGIPARADQWDAWQQSVKGTAYEAEFKARLADERQVQQVLRLPLDQQAQYVRDKHAELAQNGGDMHEIANVARLQTAVTENMKQLQNQPLVYAQARTGVPVVPLDLSKMLEPGGGEELVAQLHSRVDTINGLRAQYGANVQMKPLLDEEAKSLGALFGQLGAQAKVDALGALRSGVGPAVMVPMMQQVAKDDPVLAAASGLTAAQTTQGRNVARLALLGDEKLRAEQVKIPDSPLLNDTFQRYVGNAITTVPGKQSAMKVANAIYAQLNAEEGRFLTKENTFNQDVYLRAIRLATGGIIDYNGGKILPVRYGASAAETTTQLRAVTAGQVRTWGGVAGMTDEQAAAYIKQAPLESVGFGRYRVRAGAGLLSSPQGGAFEMTFNVR